MPTKPHEVLVLLAFAAVFVYFGLVYYSGWRQQRDGAWHIDGHRKRMMRLRNGVWEYRDMTPDEADDWHKSGIW
jgi:hypothetical protein